MDKQTKIKTFIKEAMSLAPSFRRNFTMSPLCMDPKLSPHQFYALIVIFKDGPLSMSELASRLGVSNQQLTRIVDGLVSHQLVNRIQDKTNRRIIQTKISDKGKQAWKKMHLAMQTKTEENLAVLSSEEIDQCIYHMNALTAILAKTNPNIKATE